MTLPWCRSPPWPGRFEDYVWSLHPWRQVLCVQYPHILDLGSFALWSAMLLISLLPGSATHLPWLPSVIQSFCLWDAFSQLAPDGQVSSVTGSIIRVHSFISCYLSSLQLIIHGLYVQCQEGSTSVHHHLSRTEHSTHHRQGAQHTLKECMYHITTGPPRPSRSTLVTSACGNGSEGGSLDTCKGSTLFLGFSDV